MQSGEERQNRAEAVLHALDVAEERERAEEASGDAQRVERLRTARDQGSGDTTPGDGRGDGPTSPPPQQ